MKGVRDLRAASYYERADVVLQDLTPSLPYSSLLFQTKKVKDEFQACKAVNVEIYLIIRCFSDLTN